MLGLKAQTCTAKATTAEVVLVVAGAKQHADTKSKAKERKLSGIREKPLARQVDNNLWPVKFLGHVTVIDL